MVLTSFKVQCIEEFTYSWWWDINIWIQMLPARSVLGAQQHQYGPCGGGCEDKRRQVHSPLSSIPLIWAGVLNCLSSTFSAFSKSVA